MNTIYDSASYLVNHNEKIAKIGESLVTVIENQNDVINMMTEFLVEKGLYAEYNHIHNRI